MNLIRYLLLTNYDLNFNHIMLFIETFLNVWGNETISMNQCNYYSLKPVEYPVIV